MSGGREGEMWERVSGGGEWVESESEWRGGVSGESEGVERGYVCACVCVCV